MRRLLMLSVPTRSEGSVTLSHLLPKGHTTFEPGQVYKRRRFIPQLTLVSCSQDHYDQLAWYDSSIWSETFLTSPLMTRHCWILNKTTRKSNNPLWPCCLVFTLETWKSQLFFYCTIHFGRGWNQHSFL